MVFSTVSRAKLLHLPSSGACHRQADTVEAYSVSDRRAAQEHPFTVLLAVRSPHCCDVCTYADLKADNVLLDENLRAKLSDYVKWWLSWQSNRDHALAYTQTHMRAHTRIWCGAWESSGLRH